MESTVKSPKSLIKRIEKVCAGTRRTPQQFICEAIEIRLDYEEWQLKQIDAGLADIKAGRVISDEEMWKRLSIDDYERERIIAIAERE